MQLEEKGFATVAFWYQYIAIVILNSLKRLIRFVQIIVLISKNRAMTRPPSVAEKNSLLL